MGAARTYIVLVFVLAALHIAQSILIRGPVTASLNAGRLSLKDAACGTVSILTDENTKFSSNGLPLATPNDVEVQIDGASTCNAASVSAASRVSVLPPKTVVVAPSQTGVVTRLNMGGVAYTDATGLVWAAETGFTGGHVSSTKSPISGTTRPVLYQTERYGLTALSLAVPSKGAYILHLHVVEQYWNASGKRVFDVLAQGVPLVSGLDIFARVGKNKALVLTFSLNINSTRLDLGFVKRLDNPTISAVELLAAPATPVATTTKAPTTPAATTKAPTTGPNNTVRIEDLGVGNNLQAAVNHPRAAGKIVTLPEGVFEFSDFTQASGQIGILVPSTCAGIAGSGRNTIIRMKARTSTKASSVPAQSLAPKTNQLYLMKTQGGANQIFQKFTLEGTEQGHLYGGFMVMATTKCTFQDVFVFGVPGDRNTPPGETFQINVFRGTGFIGNRIEVDGRRADGKSYGASPFGYNDHSGGVLTDCYFHHNWASTFTHWQTQNCVTYNLRSEYNGSGTSSSGLSAWGINHERTTGSIHYNPTIILGNTGNTAGHMSHNSDLADCTLKVVGGSFDKRSFAGQPYIASLKNYNGGTNNQKAVTSPVVLLADGVTRNPNFVWSH